MPHTAIRKIRTAQQAKDRSHRVEVARAALGAGTKVSSWAGRESQVLEEKDYPDGQFQSFGDLMVALNSLI